MSGPYVQMPNFAAGSKASASGAGEEEARDFHGWDAPTLARFFASKGLGAYSDALVRHKITGPLAPLLSDDDLKDVGVDLVGDRLMFRHWIQRLSRHDRSRARVASLWEGEERIYYGEWDRQLLTCGGCCPVDPSTYRLTTSHLRVNRVQHVRCGPFPLCCFGATHTSNNIDLSKVDDVDITGVPAPCCQRVLCCANGKDIVQVESRFEKDGKVYLRLPQGDGERVTNLILNQVEEAQKMDRGF